MLRQCTYAKLAAPIPLSLYLAVSTALPRATTIAVDVGHSLAKPGATSAHGVPEFTLNRELAAVVSKSLQAAGYGVENIGGQGDAKDLRARTVAALGADFFLSIHHDSVQPRYLHDAVIDGKHRRVSDRFSGFSLFVSRANAHVDASLKCASRIGEELRKAGFKPSLHHAEKIPGENRPLADEANGVYYFDDLVVLKTATMPAVLLEAGIIVNPADEASLQEPATRDKIAAAVANAMDCLK